MGVATASRSSRLGASGYSSLGRFALSPVTQLSFEGEQLATIASQAGSLASSAEPVADDAAQSIITAMTTKVKPSTALALAPPARARTLLPLHHDRALRGWPVAKDGRVCCLPWFLSQQSLVRALGGRPATAEARMQMAGGGPGGGGRLADRAHPSIAGTPSNELYSGCPMRPQRGGVAVSARLCRLWQAGPVCQVETVLCRAPCGGCVAQCACRRLRRCMRGTRSWRCVLVTVDRHIARCRRSSKRRAPRLNSPKASLPLPCNRRHPPSGHNPHRPAYAPHATRNVEHAASHGRLL